MISIVIENLNTISGFEIELIQSYYRNGSLQIRGYPYDHQANTFGLIVDSGADGICG